MASHPPLLRAAHLRNGPRSRTPLFDNASGEPAGSRFDDFEAEWRRDFDETSLAARYRYEQLAPAYRHGGVLAAGSRFAHSEWSEIERFVRRDWEQRNPGTWDQAREAIRHGWHSVRARLRLVGDSAA